MGVTGVGAVLDSAAPRWTVNRYRGLRVFHGLILYVFFFFFFLFTVDNVQ